MVNSLESKDFFDEIKKRILHFNKNVKNNSGYVVFDADGTIWSNDVGSDFYNYQIEKKFPQRAAKEGWSYYNNLLNQQKIEEALAYLAIISEGQDIIEYSKFAEDFFRAKKPNFIPEIVELISFLKKHEIKIIVLTASVEWSIVEAVRCIGLDSSNVIGVKTHVREGLITEDLIYPITFGQGKQAWLRDNKIKPLAIFGNSMGDRFMMNESKLKVVIHSAEPNESIYRSELEFIEYAEKETNEGSKDWCFFDNHTKKGLI